MTRQQFENQTKQLLTQLLPTLTKYNTHNSCRNPCQEFHPNRFVEADIPVKLIWAAYEAHETLVAGKPLPNWKPGHYQTKLTFYQQAITGWRALGTIT